MTLITNIPIDRSDAGADVAFTTPTVVHFGVVLLLSAIASAPWENVAAVAILWALLGFSGIVYTAMVARRQRLQTIYQPVLEDWLFHVLLPMTAYATLAVSACAAHFHVCPALFCVGTAALLLLFTGIHNAWDVVTYHVFVKEREKGHEKRHD